ncbi:M15 family metallopeptidase [Shewanella avicenniae]|uniref:M15 family metallopeptidase n=1 Tax=Shewanella avicenniae TaxID=2814294 RepID=A0ABX7QMD2_9GAMM|nr:M15 family metallopeptidase [Shewanella avicenniae]QSX32053.1 M15 family metallopeptidase [Shewanella avicenniae]
MAQFSVLEQQLLGLDEPAMSAFTDDDGKVLLLEPQTLAAFVRMKSAAAQDGIQLNICSAFRAFEHQCRIWNNKATGKRPLLNADSLPVDVNTLSDENLLNTLLLWSAIPGMSRHHWGTDLDLFDGSAIGRQQLQLLNSEYQPNGPCHQSYLWLEENAATFGFYRPFRQGLSGTTEELWHFSYFPVANRLQQQYSSPALAKLLSSSEIALKDTVVSQLNFLVQRYVHTVAPSPTIVTTDA